jgi:hypothetical protein
VYVRSQKVEILGGGEELYLCEIHLCVASTVRSMQQVWQYASFGVCTDVSVYVLAMVVEVREVVIMVRKVIIIVRKVFVMFRNVVVLLLCFALAFK